MILSQGERYGQRPLRGLRDKEGIEDPESSLKILILPSNCKFSSKFWIGDVETVGFPVQNVYKMTYGDENATLEPVNGYKYVYV